MNAKWGSFFLTYSWEQDGKLLATSILYIYKYIYLLSRTKNMCWLAYCFLSYCGFQSWM